MHTNHRNFLPIILGGLTVLCVSGPLTATASPKDGKKSGTYSSAAAAAEVTVATRETTSSYNANLSDRKPGPAWKTIGGTIKHIKGDVYTVEDYEGNQVQLYISRETKQLRGSKKVGDRVRAEITHSGFANSLQ
ncbi:MAG: hypothetical protein A4E19_11010 [Nitrospira sp. SG-bin1]|nr:MAG: hypothetical protein A4E19_11010 [Nitrospira sp. SG-bin1]